MQNPGHQVGSENFRCGLLYIPRLLAHDSANQKLQGLSTQCLKNELLSQEKNLKSTYMHIAR